jgi:predicted nicotinamide N-methyase
MRAARPIPVPLGPGLPEITVLRPEDQEALLEQAIERPAPELPDAGTPYYAELWPAAVPLARWLLETRAIPVGERVLELGCGLGLVGIALAKAGARVTLTDGSPDALELVREALPRNRPFFHEPAVERLDWREPAGERFPVVIGADVLYSPEAFPALAKASASRLEPGGALYLAEPKRAVARSAGEHLEREGLELVGSVETRAGSTLGVRIQQWRRKPGTLSKA